MSAQILGGTSVAMAKPGSNDAPQHRGDVAVVERRKTRAPRRYQVVLHNDDYTTMEFVVHVLMKFFNKSETEATQIMLHVHHKGHGVVGHFTRDVAETKALQVTAYAKEQGHPLKCTAEPEGILS
jgi:ATP-dependent Clp protease adaptor protein ClpS